MATRDLAKLVVRLEAQTSKYISELDKANQKLSRFEAATKKSLAGIDSAFKRLAAGVSVAVLTRSLVDLSDRYTQIENRLRLVTKAGQSLSAVQNELFKSAQRTRTSFESTVDLYARIARSSDQLGISQRELLNITETVNKAIIISGTTTQEAAAGVVQFGQALASGRLSGDELRSILENMPRLARALADGLGVTIGQLRKLGSEGELTADKVIKALQSQAPKIAAEFGKVNVTIGQSITTLQNALLKLVGQFSQSTFAGGVAEAITTLAENIEGLAKSLLVAAAAAGTFAASIAIQRLINTATAFYELYSAVASGRAILLGSAAAHRAQAVAAVTAAEATVAQNAAVIATTRAEIALTEAVLASTAATAANTGVILVNSRGQAALAGTTAAAAAAMAQKAALQGQLASLEAQAVAAQAGLAKAQASVARATGASAGAFGLLKGALAGVLAPFRALFALIVANPVGAVVAGVVAAVTALVAFSDQIKTSEDGVITLRDTAVAAWQLIAEGIAPLTTKIADTFRAIGDVVKDTFGGIIDGATKVKEALDTAFKFTPTGLIFGLIEDQAQKAFDAVQERARQIAEARQLSEVQVTVTRIGGGGGSPADEKALKTIKDLEAALRQQIATTNAGAVATIKYRIAQGDLSDEFRKAGAAANPYRKILVDLTSQQEALKIKQLATDLQQQIGAFNLTGSAALRYRLELGDLRNTFNDAGAAGRKFAEDAIYAAEALERLQLDKTLKDINAQILELKGNTAEAFSIRLEIENAPLRQQLTSLGDQAGLDQLAELERLQQAQAEFNALQTEQSRIRDELARQEERIRNSQEVGALTEVRALEQIGQAREVAVAQLDTILQKQRAIAAESANPQLAQNVEQATAELEKLASQVNLVGEAIQSAFEEHATAALEDFLVGTKNAEDAFKSFLQAIEAEIARFVARDLIKRMFGDMFSGLTASGGGGGSGLFGQLLGAAAGFFGGGGFSSVGSGAALNAAAGAAFAGGIPAMANGGRFQPNTPTLVGERGPEIVVPRNSDLVVPNHDVPSLMRSQRPIEVVNNFNISAQGGQVERRTLSQISAAAARGIADGNRRNN